MTDEPIIRYAPHVRAQLDALQPTRRIGPFEIRPSTALPDDTIMLLTRSMLEREALAIAAGYELGPMVLEHDEPGGNSYRVTITRELRPRRIQGEP